MKNLYAVRVTRTIEVETIIYVSADTKYEASDAGQDFAAANWKSFPEARLHQVGGSYSTYEKDTNQVVGDVTVDVEV